ncbi:hypothetical protein [Streptomyces avermitilis]|uniref:hypothetical protein n=1 Tax=Streptomyces avermitilis TaxID=33903 RepID=UPI0036B9A5D3
MRQVIADATRHGLVRVAPYVLAPPNAERREDLALIEAYAAQMGWRVTSSSFADIGQPPPLGERPGFGAACRYAAQGYARGILAIARPAITTDSEAYTHVLEHLYARGVFLAYLPAADDTTA